MTRASEQCVGLYGLIVNVYNEPCQLLIFSSVNGVFEYGIARKAALI